MRSDVRRWRTLQGSLIGRLARRILIELRKAQLESINRVSRRSVVDSRGPVVSLTTHGDRIRRVHLAIESVASGSALPSRIILWVDAADAAALPAAIRRLSRRGLEVAVSENFGPHTKYYPYVANEPLNAALVTMDDDILYPRWWLSELTHGSRRFPNDVLCFRAARIIVDGDRARLAPYSSWPPCATMDPSALHFATGVSGILYPSALQREARAAGTDFLQVTPKNDDVWLHMLAVRHGIAIRQLRPTSLHFSEILRGDRSGLMHDNVGAGGNDPQILATYAPAEVETLVKAQRSYSPAPGVPRVSGPASVQAIR